MQLGVQTQETLNETYTKSLGRETTTGKGEWLFDWSPYMSIRLSKKQSRATFYYNGRSQRPSNANLLPVLDISVPTRLRTGNIYLKSAYRHMASLSGSFNDPVSQRYVSLSISGQMTGLYAMITTKYTGTNFSNSSTIENSYFGTSLMYFMISNASDSGQNKADMTSDGCKHRMRFINSSDNTRIFHLLASLSL